MVGPNMSRDLAGEWCLIEVVLLEPDGKILALLRVTRTDGQGFLLDVEGGYGADPQVAPVEVGAGERMIDRALIDLYEMRGKIRALKN